MIKERLHVRLSPEIHDELMRAKTPANTISGIIEQALAAWFRSKAIEPVMDPLMLKIDALLDQQETLKQEVTFAAECTAMFARYWFAATPSLPEDKRRIANEQGARRYDLFMQEVARSIFKGAVAHESALQRWSEEALEGQKGGLTGEADCARK